MTGYIFMCVYGGLAGPVVDMKSCTYILKSRMLFTSSFTFSLRNWA